MWRSTKSNPNKYHAAYELNGELTAACNKRIKLWGVPMSASAGERGKCTRCERKVGSPAERQDPGIVRLIDAGYAAAAHDLASMARIVGDWMSAGIDVWSVDGMVDLIASKHTK